MPNILVIGSCAREHSIIKKIKHNSDINVYCIGNNKNPGILELVDEFLLYTDNNKILEYCLEKNINIVVVGPEKYLANAIVDLLQKNNIDCIGPIKDLAKIETDKFYCRQLLENNNLEKYNPKYKCYNSLDTKDEMDNYFLFIKGLDFNYVIKPTGLCSGKGVKVSGLHFSNDLEGFIYSKKCIESGQPIIIEEKIIGKEFTLMSYSDGINLSHMPVVIDFKLLEENKGPNTGSMGCISYTNHMAPFLTINDITLAQNLNKKIVSILHKNTGSYYKGILYGSFIKCVDGSIKLIEYNARYGDPECVNILELLESNLLDIYQAIINQTLNDINIYYEKTNIVSKYLVPKNYPEKTINGIHKLDINWYNDNKSNILCSSINLINNELYSTSSRTLVYFKKDINISEISNFINNKLYQCRHIFKYRNDIGKQTKISYKSSGVDIDSAYSIVGGMTPFINKTLNNNCLHNSNDFGGIVSIPNIYRNPVLITSIDGVGSKTSFISKLSNLDKLRINPYEIGGKDIVGHSINDILVKGAYPLFFMDYIASDKLNRTNIIDAVKGMSIVCSKYSIPILGGETAEMPGIYCTNEMDIAGCIVGITEKDRIIDGKRDIHFGDIVIGLYSNGLHTNGFSLIRKIYQTYGKHDTLFSNEFIRWISQPHKPYYDEIKLLDNIKINGLAHITGGGLVDNPKRILTQDKSITFYKEHLMGGFFKQIQEKTRMTDYEMYKTLNCGIGMIIVLNEYNFSKLEKIYKNHNIDYCKLGYVKIKNEFNTTVEFQ